MIPLMIDLQGKRVLIFGGGDVAARKAAYFAGCSVIVISRTFSRVMESMEVERRKMDLAMVPENELRSLVREAFLVIAATSDTVINDRIGALCRAENVLFNNAQGSPGDVILPAILEGENFLLAVSTGGKSPAFSRYLRSQLDLRRKEFDGMIKLQERLRLALKEISGSQDERSTILWSVMTDPLVWEMLKTEPLNAWTMVEEKYLHG
jgi:precorrin-2 dehydrogenase/sirohydrochlorin ferrochelatase